MTRQAASPLLEDVDSILKQETNEAEELPPILQASDDILTLIANKLDARSFIRLASSSRRLHSFCNNPRNGVRIALETEKLEVREEEDGSSCCFYKSEMLPAELRTDNPQFHLFVEGILAWPFSIKLRVLEFCAVGKEEEVVSLLEKVKVQRIQEVFLVERVPFTVLSACVDKYKVQELLIGGDAEYTEVEMEALLRKPLRHLEMPEIPYELFMDTNIPKLRIPGADVTTAGLSAIFKRFLDGDGLIDWRMEHEMTPRDLDNCLGDYLQLNANYSGALPPQRPLAVYSFGEDEGDKIYHVLREDGRIIHVSNFFVDDFGDSTCFKVKQCPLADAPAILSR